MSAASVATSTTTTEQWRGPVLEVVQRLLRGHEHGREVLAVFRKLVARNRELELQLHELKSRWNKGEGVSTAQLLLLLEGLEPSKPSSNGETEKGLAPCSPDAQEANEPLRRASGFGESSGAQPPPPQKPPPQPSVRRPFPEQLKRTEVVIRVPEDERACSKCSQEGTHIGYDTVEIADLEPAQVIVRVERREKLACEHCEVALTRARLATASSPAGASAPGSSGSCWLTSTMTVCPCIVRRSAWRDSACPSRYQRWPIRSLGQPTC